MPRAERRFALLVGLLRLSLVLGIASACAPGLAYAKSISGVCPDGSMFIVQKRSAIPCSQAKEVEPGNIPPMKPEYLPRPYGWETFNRETDPNNPYNVIDAAAPVGDPAPSRGSAPPPPPPVRATSPQPSVSLPPAPRVASAPPSAPQGPAFSPAELSDLAAIVEARQSAAPATLLRPGDTEERGLELRLAHSGALDARVKSAQPGAGPVVAFHVLARDAGTFWGNLTFVQGHVAHYSDPQDPKAFRVLDGGLGSLKMGDRVLGYAVLPPGVDPSQPIDIYWDDRRLTATLAPPRS